MIELRNRLKNERLLLLLLVFSTILIILNLLTVRWTLIGVFGAILFFLIGGDFVGVYLLREEQPLIRVSLGILVLLSVMGLMGWGFIIFRGLGVVETSVILVVTLSLVVLARFVGGRNVRRQPLK